ncbi:Uncharacterized protein DAT39_011805 [Clarias magur]|uniref:Uncharacterized protein n=1 Tax=Clarias magur TaxID=1594786 RepID=A0A8J4TVH5_CLAMG|nr:Uncharacterized protein DAT39_011805 [Clarias magur]
MRSCNIKPPSPSSSPNHHSFAFAKKLKLGHLHLSVWLTLQELQISVERKTRSNIRMFASLSVRIGEVLKPQHIQSEGSSHKPH